MKHFTLSTNMTTIRGVFYPTGHMVMMFPTEQDALHAAKLLKDDGLLEEDLSLATPEEFERETRDAANERYDLWLPSIGTEGDTVQHFRQLAREGHYALIVHASAKVSSQRVLDLLKDSHLAYGQRYRHFVIEDMVG